MLDRGEIPLENYNDVVDNRDQYFENAEKLTADRPEPSERGRPMRKGATIYPQLPPEAKLRQSQNGANQQRTYWFTDITTFMVIAVQEQRTCQ